MIVSFISVACLTTGGIVWTTVLQRAVPARMIGRVSSLDWVLTLGLAPVSYALTGPIADELGARSTLLGCGVLGGIVLVFVFLFVPGVRNVGTAEEEEEPTAAAA